MLQTSLCVEFGADIWSTTTEWGDRRNSEYGLGEDIARLGPMQEMEADAVRRVIVNHGNFLIGFVR